MRVAAVLGAKSAVLMKVVSGVGLLMIAALAYIQPPPIGNPWFDIPLGALVWILIQCFAYSLEPPRKESSDWYKSFYRFWNVFARVGILLTKYGDFWDKLGVEKDRQ